MINFYNGYSSLTRQKIKTKDQHGYRNTILQPHVLQLCVYALDEEYTIACITDDVKHYKNIQSFIKSTGFFCYKTLYSFQTLSPVRWHSQT